MFYSCKCAVKQSPILHLKVSQASLQFSKINGQWLFFHSLSPLGQRTLNKAASFHCFYGFVMGYFENDIVLWKHIWTRACFLSLAQSKLRLCSANHRTGYWSNLPCDWPSTAWAYSEQETENGPRGQMDTSWPLEEWLELLFSIFKHVLLTDILRILCKITHSWMIQDRWYIKIGSCNGSVPHSDPAIIWINIHKVLRCYMRLAILSKYWYIHILKTKLLFFRWQVS